MALIPLYFPFFHCLSPIYGPKGTVCENEKDIKKKKKILVRRHVYFGGKTYCIDIQTYKGTFDIHNLHYFQ